MSVLNQTDMQLIISFLLCLLLFHPSYGQPTSSPTSSEPKKMSNNLYGPADFTTLDWILSACILTIIIGIFICCCCCVRHKLQRRKPQSEISVKSGINQSEMVAINHKVNSNIKKTRPQVSQSFGSAHELPQHIKKDSRAFDAAITGIALTKKDSTYSPIENMEVEVEIDLDLNETYEDHQYGSYNVDTNRHGYSPLAQLENEEIHTNIKNIVDTKPPPKPPVQPNLVPPPVPSMAQYKVPPRIPPPVPPKVPEAILNELNGNNEEKEYESEEEYLSIEETKALKGGDKEKRLNDEHFTSVFGMTKDQFYKLPKWKQKNIKKSKGFF